MIVLDIIAVVLTSTVLIGLLHELATTGPLEHRGEVWSVADTVAMFAMVALFWLVSVGTLLPRVAA